MNIVKEGCRVFDIEIEALVKTRNALGSDFEQILELVTECRGRVIITGIGKPGHIGHKIAATMSSLGTPSFFLHPSEALHGDLGMVTADDIVIAISYSGESEEITKILPNIRLIGAKLIGITGNSKSTLAQLSDFVQVLPEFNEACYLKLAPSSSTTAVLAYGDALAIVASGVYGFTEQNFGMYHPAGSLGKKILLRVDDIMILENDNPIVNESTMLTDAIVLMSQKQLGVVFAKDSQDMLSGIITDGDLRRIIEKNIDLYTAKVNEVMVRTPFAIKTGTMAIKAFEEIKKRSINCVPIIDEDNHIIGTVTLQMLTKAGLVL